MTTKAELKAIGTGIIESISVTSENFFDSIDKLRDVIVGYDTAEDLPKAAEKINKKVTKKEAESAYDALAWVIQDLQGHTSEEFQKRNVYEALAMRMAIVQELIDRGWNDKAINPDSVMESAYKMISRWKAMNGDASATVLPDANSLIEKVQINKKVVDDIAGENGIVMTAWEDNFEDKSSPSSKTVVSMQNGNTFTLRAASSGWNFGTDINLDFDESHPKDSAVLKTTLLRLTGKSNDVSNNPEKEQDKQYLQSFISGNVDFMEMGIFEKINDLYTKYENDPEMFDYVSKAIDEYSKFAMGL